MGKIVWGRPSGTEITTNDADETIKAAAQLGWKPKDQAAAAVTPDNDTPRRPGRPKKDD